ncbi:tetratricopeptide repeat protein, partial [Chloroflexota bacterium]
LKTLYYSELGQVYEAVGDHGQALAQYAELVKLMPYQIDGYLAQGGVYYKGLQQYDKALPYYELAMRLDPGNHRLLIQVAQLYEDAGDTKRALETALEAVDVAPTEQKHQASYLAGQFYLAQGEFALAQELYQKSIEGGANWARSHAGLGQIYLVQGDCDKAEPEFREALRIEPNLEIAREGLEACLQE